MTLKIKHGFLVVRYNGEYLRDENLILHWKGWDNLGCLYPTKKLAEEAAKKVNQHFAQDRQASIKEVVRVKKKSWTYDYYDFEPTDTVVSVVTKMNEGGF